jgi:large subunit ribosomal protein L2
MGKNIIQQARGKGGPSYKSPGFRSIGKPKHKKLGESAVKGKIVDIISCPLHSSPLLQVLYEDGDNVLMIAPEGVKVGDEIISGGDEAEIGNTMSLKNIPEGTLVYNIEHMPGDGGKFVRTSGSFARVATKLANEVLVTLPSKRQKRFVPECRASIGIIAGSGRKDKPFLKAGIKHFAKRAKNKIYPIVSGSAMNAVDHPFGNKRTSRKSKAKPVPRNAPPGRKVGMLRPKRTGKKKSRVQ